MTSESSPVSPPVSPLPQPSFGIGLVQSHDENEKDHQEEKKEESCIDASDNDDDDSTVNCVNVLKGIATVTTFTDANDDATDQSSLSSSCDANTTDDNNNNFVEILVSTPIDSQQCTQVNDSNDDNLPYFPTCPSATTAARNISFENKESTSLRPDLLTRFPPPRATISRNNQNALWFRRTDLVCRTTHRRHPNAN